MRYSQLPWQPKMVRNAGQANLLGGQAWRLINTLTSADGSIHKRWGTDLYSKYILVKEPIDVCHKHDFSQPDNWVGLETHDPLLDDEIALTGNSSVRLYSSGAAAASSQITHIRANSTVLTNENQVGIRFLSRFSTLPATTTATNYATVLFDLSANKYVQISFSQNGIYCQGALQAGTAGFVDGSLHTWEIVINVAALTYIVYLDDTAITTAIALSTGTNTAGLLTLKYGADAGTTLEVFYDYIYVTSKTESDEDLWTIPPIRGLFEYANSVQNSYFLGRRYLIAHCGTSIWVDEFLDGRFRQFADNISNSDGIPTYCVFRDRLATTDSVTNTLLSWNTVGVAIQHASAPKCSFVVPYSARLWLSGDPAKPLRVYFSGIRNMNDWTTQEGGSFTSSGYLDMEEHVGGDRVVSLHGPWKGLLIVKTLRTIQVVDATGGNPNLFSRRTIVYGLGGAAANDTAFVGNDLYFMSDSGVQSLQAVQEYGDIAQVYLSAPINDLWASAVSEYKIIGTRKQFTWATAHPQEAIALWALAMNDSAENNYILVWDYRAQTWHFWHIAAACLTFHRAPDETGGYILYGGYDGKVYIFNANRTKDVDAEYTAEVETGRVDFKDYPDPQVQLRDHIKLFKTLHLHIKPRSNTATCALTVYADERDPVAYTMKHDAFASPGLEDYNPATQRLRSAEAVGVISKAIDSHGKYIRFKLEQATGDLVLLGWEIDFGDEGFGREYGV